MAITTIAPHTINPKLIVPFMNAVRNVLKTMAGVEVRIDQPHVKKQASAIYDVSGIIGFSGKITGSMVVSLTRDTALKLVEAFGGAAVEWDSPELVDAVGELANMIAGNAKPHLGAVASISVPSVVIGTGYSVANLSNTPCLVIPCSSACGEFAVEVCIQ